MTTDHFYNKKTILINIWRNCLVSILTQELYRALTQNICINHLKFVAGKHNILRQSLWLVNTGYEHYFLYAYTIHVFKYVWLY